MFYSYYIDVQLSHLNKDYLLTYLHVEAWSQTNNLTLNRAKSLEIVFTDKRRK